MNSVMQTGSISKVEKNVDQAASVLFGVACGYSAFLWMGAGGRLAPAVIAALSAALALITYLLAFRFLSAIKSPARAVPVRAFRLHEVEPLEDEGFPEFDSSQRGGLLAAPVRPVPDELLLTDPVEAPAAEVAEPEELLLTENYEVEALDPAEEPMLELTEPVAEEAPESEDVLELHQPIKPDEVERSETCEVESPVAEENATEDEFADFGPNSRVVRLFDVAAMPTPGELGSQIDRHLQGEPAQVQSAEAAQALQDALAELRRAIPNRLR
jgi:hypothetical protein